MLLRSKTNLLFTVDMTLYFDDNTEKQVTFTENSYMLMRFRYNGNKVYDVVKVAKIAALFDRLGNYDGCKITLDLAHQFDSKRIIIHTSDILNAKVISEEAAMDLYNAGDSLVITDEMFKPDPVEEVDPDMGVIPDEQPSDPEDTTEDGDAIPDTNEGNSGEDTIPEDSENSSTDDSSSTDENEDVSDNEEEIIPDDSETDKEKTDIDTEGNNEDSNITTPSVDENSSTDDSSSTDENVETDQDTTEGGEVDGNN